MNNPRTMRQRFLKTLERYARIDELVFDATLFVLLAVFMRLFSASSVLKMIPPLPMMIILLVMEILVPLYLALIYADFREHARENGLYRLASWAVFPLGLILSLVICFYLPFAIAQYKDSGVLQGYAFINTVLGLLMVMSGWDLGTRLDGRREGKASQGMHTAFTVVNYAIMPLVILATLIHSLMIKSPLPFLAACVGYLATGLLAGSGKRMDNLFAHRSMRILILPFILCGLFSLSTDFLNDLLVIHFRGHTMAALLASGLLPVRVFLLVSPPVKPVNLLVGTAAIIALITEGLRG